MQLSLFANRTDGVMYLLPIGTEAGASGGLLAHVDDNGKPLCGATVGKHHRMKALCSWNLCEECKDQSQ